MSNTRVALITGTRKGIGRHLAESFLKNGFRVIGCSRGEPSLEHANYRHFSLDVADEPAVQKMLAAIKAEEGRLDVLLNNAGIASMNHSVLTPLDSVRSIFETNVFGTFLLCRESAKIMRTTGGGRIVNFVTVALPLKLEGEAAYVASKAAVLALTQVLAKELAPWNITVNAVGPTPVKTDLISKIPDDKIQRLIHQQAIHRLGEFTDVENVVEFFVRPESSFITGQVLYLGGV